MTNQLDHEIGSTYIARSEDGRRGEMIREAIVARDANDKMRLIRDKQLFNLELLREIYEKDRATGDGVESAKEKVQRWEREQREIRIEDIDEIQINNEIHLENFSSFNNHNSPSTPNNQAQTTSMLDVADFVIERSLFQRN
ncbi:unnamed protein product [Dovyalis caffra]|uniref:Uncharacterized protein n=1 Tax=Dovyalis caffra TaxID=77055 RepID=A0AAV1RF03_9ROSI|nr:unnamed protein product [Dovyalis caffra]